MTTPTSDSATSTATEEVKPNPKTAKPSTATKAPEPKTAEPKVPNKTSTSTKTKTAMAAALEKAGTKDAIADSADFLSVGSAVPKAVAPEEEVVAANVSLPPTLEFLQDVKGTANGSCFTLAVYGEGCLECGSLIPTLQDSEATSEPECHFRFGNIHCPAAYHRIQIVGTRILALDRVRKAQLSGDSNRLLRQLTKLDSLSIEDKNFVLKEIGLFQG